MRQLRLRPPVRSVATYDPRRPGCVTSGLRFSHGPVLGVGRARFTASVTAIVGTCLSKDSDPDDGYLYGFQRVR